MGCPDITSNVILTGILPMMLRVLEDSVCKLSPDYSTTGMFKARIKYLGFEVLIVSKSLTRQDLRSKF